MLLQTINKTLDAVTDLLLQLSATDYCSPCSELGNATIGEHTRHIVEMFQCLQNQYDSGFVDYDLRERNVQLQTDTKFAISQIQEIKSQLDKPNKEIELHQIVQGETVKFNTNYFRELLYNLEHCVHHQALIKVALFRCDYICVDENFGVARATIEYKNQCVQ